MSHLIKRYTSYDTTLLADILSCIAANIEDAYILSGAVAGRDYNYNDLMSLAVKYLSGTKQIPDIHTETIIRGEPD
ncbi:hypothetical protein PRB00_005198 [Escherichia coli]|uniref:hypothetical protein n=1 Tax=Escherichia coli TaxID=562 RepID=UPI0007A5F4AA|nr:hypothetical protein [Escherichia coli]EHT2169718.1 hypothetical protein [Escherichia coli O168]EET7793317.1 hypothetical protein [Escherichia coli]EEV6906345.1 hypothetical protein [Escherichia coli]EEV7741004.1 hypothetical protein [Escherichia coli]EEY3208774.1 hypothetical protein [Escherichia coli]